MALAGVAGYIALWIAVRTLTAVEYASFGAFWAGLYFAVGSLSGLQQEVTRAAMPVRNSHSSNRQNFANSSVFITFAVAGVSIVLFLGLVASNIALEQPLDFLGVTANVVIGPFVIALSGYILVAVVAGCLYSVERWSVIAWMIFGDSSLRLIFILFVLWQGYEPSALYWAVAIPFPLTLFILLPWVVLRLRGKIFSDVKIGKFSMNSMQAIGAAMGMALLMSGFPLLISVTSSQDQVESVSHAMFAVTVARAPFIVVAVSLQSLILVRFKTTKHISKAIKKISVYFVGAGSVVFILGLFLGRPILDFLLGTQAHISSLVIGTIVLSGVALTYMIVTGVAVLSRSQHVAYLFGWGCAAAGTSAALMLPLTLEPRLVIALVVGPLLGIAIHLRSLSKPQPSFSQ